MTPQYRFTIYKAENGWIVEGGKEGSRQQSSVMITSNGVTVGNLIDATLTADRIAPTTDAPSEGKRGKASKAVNTVDIGWVIDQALGHQL